MLQIKKAGGQVIETTFDQSYSITVRIEKPFQNLKTPIKTHETLMNNK